MVETRTHAPRGVHKARREDRRRKEREGSDEKKGWEG